MPPAASKSPEDVFSQPFKSSKMDTASAGVDKLDDLAQKATNPILAAKAFYTANSATLNAAADALVNLNSNAGIARAAKDVLAPVRKIVDGLDSLTKIHPFIAVGVLLFKAVIEIELKRRENDRRTLSLVLQMADMMGTLLQLKDVKDPDLKTEAGETVTGRLQLLMKAIENDIKECGKAVDTYRKQHVMVKFFKAPMWEGKLVAIGNGLGERKTQITFALTIHTAVGVDQMNAQAVEMQFKLDLVLKYVVEQKTPTEIEWEKEMDKLGGREACMTDPAKMAKISAIFAARDGASNIETDTADAGEVGTKSAKKDKDSLSVAQKHALSASVDELIEDNSTLYERKLFQQTEQIKDAIATSTTLILSRLDAGPHELIKHPVIRHIWQEMKWRSSVKARTFVLSLLDYYIDRSARQSIISEAITTEPERKAEPQAETTSAVNGSADGSATVDAKAAEAPAATATPEGAPTGADVPAETLVEVEASGEQADVPPTVPKPVKDELAHDPEDDWCIQYLSVFNVPAIIEAFDDDASGYVKIKEVNEFTDGIPPTWTLIQWLAYWSAGWRLETIKYSRRILKIFNKMVELFRTANISTNADIKLYLERKTLGDVKSLCRLATTDVTADDNLRRLVDARMEESIGKWKRLLEQGQYEIDSTDSFVQLTGGRRVESFIFPTVYVILRHHLRLIKLCQKFVLDGQDLNVAWSSVWYVLDSVFDRMKKLTESFRQQHVDPAEQFQFFAGGIFATLYKTTTGTEVELMTGFEGGNTQEAIDEAALIDSEEEPTMEITKYDLIGLEDSSLIEAASWKERKLSKYYKPAELETDIPRPRALFRLAGNAVLAQVKEILHRRTWAAMKKRRDLRLEYLRLQLQYQRYLDFVNYNIREHPFEDPRQLPVDEDKRLDKLIEVIPARDQDLWHSIYIEVFRKDLLHTGCRCDGCRASPPLGLRFRCVQCDDFDYCERCEKQPPAVNLSGDTTHKVDHEMIKIPWPLTRFTVRVYKSKAAEVLKKRLGATDPTKKRKATNTEDESESEEEEEEEDDDDDDDDEGGGSGGGDGGGEENGEESEDEDTDPDELEAIYDRVLAHDKFTDGDEEKGAAAEPDKATATDAGNAQPSTEVPTSAVDTPTTPPITSNSLAALATQTGADTEAIVSKPVRTYSCSNGCGRNDLILHYVCLDCDDDYILCPECDEAFTEAHRHGTTVSTKKVEPEKATDNSKEAGTSDESKPEEAKPAKSDAEESKPEANEEDSEGGGSDEDEGSEEEASEAEGGAAESAPVAAEGEAKPAAEAGEGPSEAAPEAADEDETLQSKKHDGKHVVLIIKDLKDRSTVPVVEDIKDQASILRQLKEDVSSRFGGVDAKFGTMDSKFTSLEARFAKVEDILNRLALHMGL